MLEIKKNNLDLLDIYLTWGGVVISAKTLSNKLLRG